MKIGKGFNLIELMIVLAIVAILSAIALPGFMRFVAKAKRTEAYVTLRSLYAAEKSYWIENGAYSNLLGGDGIGWKPEGHLNYTYGFAGSDGKNHIIGKWKTPGSALQNTKATGSEFVIAAAGYIQGDDKPDILTIDHNGTIVIVKDALT